jgi:hypothetical protein
MVCGDSTIIAKVAMIVMIVSVVCSTIAIFTPYWNETEGANGDTIYTGLVVQCNNTLGVCVSVQDILDKYGNSRKLYSLRTLFHLFSMYSRRGMGDSPIFLRFPPYFSEAGGKFYTDKQGKKINKCIKFSFFSLFFKS